MADRSAATTLDRAALRADVAARWREDTLGPLRDYIAIPNVSPAFDAEWADAGHMDRAVDLVDAWCRKRIPEIAGMTVSVEQLPGRTPIVVCDIPATAGVRRDDTVLLYGHLDKQPEMTGWRDGLGPWTPVQDGDRLYGRGGADDGYAVFAALHAIAALQAAGGRHGRLVVLIEASEESGSPDLPAHLDSLGDRLGDVSLVIALDSGCADYERLWVTTSLRGVLVGTLTVEVLTEGVHSGSAGGIVPSSFRILRRLLDRIEDPDTGRVLVPELWGDVPDERAAQIAATADRLAADLHFPFPEGVSVDARAPEALVRARTWEPAIANIAMAGFPPPERAGNVLRPSTSLTIAARLAPTADPVAAGRALTAALTTDPPAGARVRFAVGQAEAGWNAPPTAPWLQAAVDDASSTLWGSSAGAMGEGGTIPFMGMLGRRYPDAQFLITGVLGPESNAHGPNEFLHLPTAERITAAVALVLDAHADT